MSGMQTSSAALYDAHGTRWIRQASSYITWRLRVGKLFHSNLREMPACCCIRSRSSNRQAVHRTASLLLAIRLGAVA